jgi:hypothetical protein
VFRPAESIFPTNLRVFPRSSSVIRLEPSLVQADPSMFLEKPSMGSTTERRFSMKHRVSSTTRDGFQERQRVDRMFEATFSMEVVVDPKRASYLRYSAIVVPACAFAARPPRGTLRA